MNHPTDKEWSAYLYGELDPGRRVVLEKHLQSCSECQENADTCRAVMKELDLYRVPESRKRITEVWPYIGWGTRRAVAAVLLVTAGYIAGILLSPQPPDIEQLQAALKAPLESSLKTAFRQEILEEVNHDRQLVLANACSDLKDELNQALQHKINQSAVKFLADSQDMTDQRFKELVLLIEQIRIYDRQKVVDALDQIESNRLWDKTQFLAGLQIVAAQANDLSSIEEN